jgi:hypothetical protein
VALHCKLRLSCTQYMPLQIRHTSLKCADGHGPSGFRRRFRQRRVPEISATVSRRGIVNVKAIIQIDKSSVKLTPR